MMAQEIAKKNGFLAWLCWFLAAMLYFVQYGLLIFPSALSQELKGSLQITPLDIGIFSSAFLYTYTLMQIPVGLLYDHFRARNLLVFSALIMVLGCVILALSHNFHWGMVSRMIMGVGGSFAFLGALCLGKSRLAAALFPVIVGLTEAMSGMGEMSMQTLFAALKKFQNWRIMILEVGFIILLTGVLIFFLVKDKHPKKTFHPIRAFSEIKTIFTDKMLWLLGLCTGFGYAYFFVLADLWGLPFLKLRYHIPTFIAALVDDVIIVGFTVGCFFVGWLTRWFNERKILLTAVLLELFFLIFICWIRMPLWLTVIVWFVLGIVTSGLVLTFDIVKRVVPNERYGMASGFINMSFGGVSILAVPFVGYLIPHFKGTNPENIFFAATPLFVFSFISVILAILILKERRLA